MFPWQTIIVSIILVIAYILLRGGLGSMSEQISKRRQREAALRSASIYLSPYTNIWNNLKLSNKYCSMRLSGFGSSIVARDKKNIGRTFRVINSSVHTYDDLWNMFCLSFSHNTTFDELVQLAERYAADIELKDVQKSVVNSQELSTQRQVRDSNDNLSVKTEKKELLDVNNASEVELTALPGVSIVMAKKLIKKREEIGGFKSVNDVCLFLHLKPHMQKQLEQLICVKKMKGSVNLQRYNERRIDL